MSRACKWMVLTEILTAAHMYTLQTYGPLTFFPLQLKLTSLSLSQHHTSHEDHTCKTNDRPDVPLHSQTITRQVIAPCKSRTNRIHILIQHSYSEQHQDIRYQTLGYSVPINLHILWSAESWLQPPHHCISKHLYSPEYQIL